jgi:hypothetical protein
MRSETVLRNLAVRTGLGVLLVLVLGLRQPVEAGLVAPNVNVAGKSQNDWAEQWWNWAGNIPEASNPVVETTGAFSHLGDQGPVFFLAGVFNGPTVGPVNRTVTVRENQHLFFPLLNSITWDIYSAYPDDFERDLIETMGDIENLFAELNGVPLGSSTSLLGWLQQSPDNYDQHVLAGGLFNEWGDPVGIEQAQQRGYWLMLEPLSVGTHVLHFGGRAQPNGAYANWGPNIQDITYTIQVQAVPEPGTLAGAGLAAAGALVWRRWRSRPRALRAVGT